MRENRPFGSEGGGPELKAGLPTPISTPIPAHREPEGFRPPHGRRLSQPCASRAGESLRRVGVLGFSTRREHDRGQAATRKYYQARQRARPRHARPIGLADFASGRIRGSASPLGDGLGQDAGQKKSRSWLSLASSPACCGPCGGTAPCTTPVFRRARAPRDFIPARRATSFALKPWPSSPRRLSVANARQAVFRAPRRRGSPPCKQRLSRCAFERDA
jgi:hypothetical protein